MLVNGRATAFAAGVASLCTYAFTGVYQLALLVAEGANTCETLKGLVPPEGELLFAACNRTCPVAEAPVAVAAAGLAGGAVLGLLFGGYIGWRAARSVACLPLGPPSLPVLPGHPAPRVYVAPAAAPIATVDGSSL